MVKKICQLHPKSPRVSSRCRDCSREKAREWNAKHRDICLKRNKVYHAQNSEKISIRKKAQYKANPLKYRLSARKTLLKIKYGLSLDTYNDMLASQGGVCAICKKPETQISNKKGGVDSLRVDHCHKTGAIRGLLCSRCNFGISQFDDDVQRLQKAINYLAGTRSAQSA